MTTISRTDANYPTLSSVIQQQSLNTLDTLGDGAARIMDYTKIFFGTSFDPIKHTLYFLFPSFGAYWTESTPVQENNPTQEAYMPLLAKNLALREIRRLEDAASLCRRVILYTKPEGAFYNYGGSCSLFSPIIFTPHEQIFRIGASTFGAERADENLAGRLWHFSDQEMRFLLAREIGRVKYNDQFLRVAAKVIIIAAVTMIFTLPLTFSVCFGLSLLTASTYLFFSSAVEYALDSFGADTLARATGINVAVARQIGAQALSKIVRQNLDKKSRFWSDDLFITTSGNDLRNYTEPFLTARISRLSNF